MLDHCTRVRSKDFEQPWFKDLAIELGLDPNVTHRKIWEYVVIAQVFNEIVWDRDNSTHVLGFGCGKEPLPKWFLSHDNCIVTASDAPGNNPDWALTGQLSKSLSDLGIDKPNPSISFLEVDMNHIPQSLLQGQFDFTWSCGSFEHIGGLDKSIEFFCNQMACLKPGGIACHTTEFNYESQSNPSQWFNSNDPTLNEHNLCLFRYQDLAKLAGRLWLQGDELLSPDLQPGNGEQDLFVDKYPYGSAHLNIQIGNFKTTSIMLIAQRGGQ
jgi:hypothetical protein